MRRKPGQCLLTLAEDVTGHPGAMRTQWSHSYMRLSKFIQLCFESVHSVIRELYQDEKREQK